MSSPDEPRSAARDPGLVFGVLIGLLTACVLGSGAAVVVAKKTKAREGHGWALAPVVVVAVDLDPGTDVTMETISQRSIPEQHVTPSMVLPAEASFAVNHRALVGLRAGDILLWSALDDSPTDACRALAETVAGPTSQRSPDLRATLAELNRLAAGAP
ncbi:MAG: hypothetical protein JNJ54_32195 [Myxococcaceae bacterium]|nr:hypothetical protein [Myxococcaceae bacterium]